MSKRSASDISTDDGAANKVHLSRQEWDIIRPFVENLSDRALNADEATRMANNLSNSGVSVMRCLSVVSYVSLASVSRA